MDILMSLKKDHVHGLESSMKFGTFGSVREYYVGFEERAVILKEEKWVHRGAVWIRLSVHWGCVTGEGGCFLSPIVSL